VPGRVLLPVAFGLMVVLWMIWIDWLSVALLALSVVILLTLVWELGEYAGDRLLDTTLKPSKRGSAEDIFFDTQGAWSGSRSPPSSRSCGRRTRDSAARP
jgi:hypothetical protein